MKIFYIPVEYTLFLRDDFQVAINRDVSIRGPISARIDTDQGAAYLMNSWVAHIDNKEGIEYPEAFTISQQKHGQASPILHAHNKSYKDGDKDVLVYMSFTEHHDVQSYPAFFHERAIIQMLDIRTEDIISLGYNRNRSSIHYIFFVFRNEHRTKGILGGKEIIINKSWELVIEKK